MCIPPTSPGFLNAECAICVKTHINGSILYLLNLLLPSTYIWLKAPPSIFSFSAASRYFPSVKNASAAWCTIVHSDTPAGLPLPSCESLDTRHEKYDWKKLRNTENTLQLLYILSLQLAWCWPVVSHWQSPGWVTSPDSRHQWSTIITHHQGLAGTIHSERDYHQNLGTREIHMYGFLIFLEREHQESMAL